jgi:hypothetical protein
LVHHLTFYDLGRPNGTFPEVFMLKKGGSISLILWGH